MPAPLSLCVIARDEAAHLLRCLRSVASLATELIVADTGSRDATPDLARAGGARVLTVPWAHDFAAARNATLAAATQPWILVLDADEYLAPAAVAELSDLLATAPVGRAAYQLLFCNHRDGHEIGGRTLVTRLFPNRPDVRYEWPIHEQVDTSLHRAGVPISSTTIPLIHTGYADPAVVLKKQQRNRTLLCAVVAAGQATAHTHYFLGAAAQDLDELPAAIASYRVAAAWPVTDPINASLRDAALVKLVECLARSGDHAGVLAVTTAPEAAGTLPSHPALRFHRAIAGLRTGDAGAPHATQRRELVALLDTTSDVQIPALDLAWLKGSVLAELSAQAQHAGNATAALALLRLARTALAAPASVSSAAVRPHIDLLTG